MKCFIVGYDRMEKEWFEYEVDTTVDIEVSTAFVEFETDTEVVQIPTEYITTIYFK